MAPFFILLVVSEQFGTGKKSRKNLILEKVSELVSEKFGARKSLGTSTKNETLIFVAKIFMMGTGTG